MSVIATLKIIRCIYRARKTRIKHHTCNYGQFALFLLSHAFRRRLDLFYIDQKDTRNLAQACVGPNLTRQKTEHRFVIPTVRYNVASLTVLQFQSLPNFPNRLSAAEMHELISQRIIKYGSYPASLALMK